VSEKSELRLENPEYLGSSLNIEEKMGTVELKRVLYLQVLTQV